jgi:SAM-dependent methyltransferase
MREASKTNQYRTESFFSDYLSGKVLDIGAGNDLVCPHAIGFDMEDGDANYLNRYFPENSFDAVHSSHSLEHMVDPVQALQNWWPLVKPGGYLVLVVPDEDLYEQGIWPSAFNTDHKTTFRLDKSDSWSPVSYEIRSLCSSLPGAEVVSAEVQNFNFAPELVFPRGLIVKRKYPRYIKWLMSLAKRVPFLGKDLERNLKISLIKKGYPFDQSKYDVCAQIQIVVRKSDLSVL